MTACCSKCWGQIHANAKLLASFFSPKSSPIGISADKLTMVGILLLYCAKRAVLSLYQHNAPITTWNILMVYISQTTVHKLNINTCQYSCSVPPCPKVACYDNLQFQSAVAVASLANSFWSSRRKNLAFAWTCTSTSPSIVQQSLSNIADMTYVAWPTHWALKQKHLFCNQSAFNGLHQIAHKMWV